jgi:arabinofuranosyltransferase
MRSPFSMVTILGALFYALYERSGRLLALACGVLLYLAYVVLIGGDYMDGRFIAAPFFLAVVVLSRLPFRWASTESTVMAVTALTLGLAWPYSPVRSGRDYGTGPEVNYYWKGISDERAGWYPKSGLLAPDKKVKPIDHRWVEEGLAAAQGTKTVIERAGIGLFGFFAGPRVYAVDVHALGDPLLARLPTHTPRKWRIGHFRRNIPDGYMATVETGRNVIEDSSLARYYDILSVITRGELLSIGRLKEVWRFNAGSYDHLMRDYLSHPLTVAYEKFSSPRARGTPYLSPGNKIPSVSGLRVDLDSVVHLPHAEISIDSNDDYVLEYRLGTKVSGRNIIGTQRIQEGGLRVDTLTIPPEAVSCGYDNVLILPRGGDETYSVGHLRLF